MLWYYHNILPGILITAIHENDVHDVVTFKRVLSVGHICDKSWTY